MYFHVHKKIIFVTSIQQIIAIFVPFESWMIKVITRLFVLNLLHV